MVFLSTPDVVGVLPARAAKFFLGPVYTLTCITNVDKLLAAAQRAEAPRRLCRAALAHLYCVTRAYLILARCLHFR